MRNIKLDNGKYQVLGTAVLHEGQMTRDITGDKFINTLLVEIENLRETLDTIHNSWANITKPHRIIGEPMEPVTYSGNTPKINFIGTQWRGDARCVNSH